MSVRISVIVPVYNVEYYLEECVSSILKQDYTDFELLLVDDGSTDSSGTLCDTIQQTDPRIRVFHKPNGGLSDARNYGIKHASGGYLTFIDSDDFILQGYLSSLIKLIEEEHADASCLQIYSIGDRGFRPDNSVIETGCITGAQAVTYSLIRKYFGVTACGKLFKTELFKKQQFPVGQLFEDLLTIPYVFEKCEKVVWSTTKLYMYYNRPGSITRSRITDRHLAILDNTKELISYLDAYCPQAHDAAVARFCIDSVNCLVDVLLLTDEYFKKIDIIKEKCKTYWHEGMHNPLLPKNTKTQIRAIQASTLLYWLIFKPYKKRKYQAEKNAVG